MTEPVTTTPPRWTEYVPLDDIKRHPDNPKRHAAADIEASVGRFGYTEAVRGNGYGLLQATTEYLDHARTYQNRDTYLGRSVLRSEPAKAKAVNLIRGLA